MYQFVGPGNLRRDLFVLCTYIFVLLQTCQCFNPLMRYPPTYQQRVAYACENNLLFIDCPDGHLIRIIRANYGRFSISICNQRGVTDHWNLQCMSTSTRIKVLQRCDGRHMCTMKASNQHFHDSCPGTNKYLEINYYCEPEEVSPTPSTVPTSTLPLSTTPLIVHTTVPPTSLSTKHTPIQKPPSTAAPSTTTNSTTTTTTTITTTTTTFPSPTTPSPASWLTICRAESVAGTHWETTREGATVSKNCPGDKIGELKRYCSSIGWMDILDISDCISPKMKDIEDLINQSSISDAANELSDMTSAQSLDVGDLKKTATVLLPNLAKHFRREIKDKPAKKKLETVKTLSKDLVKTGSNLLSMKQESSWKQMIPKQRQKLATSLAISMEETAFEVAATIETQGTMSTVDKNILMEVNVVNTDQHQSDLKFPSDLNLEHSAWQETSDYIVIPKESLTQASKNGKLKVVFLVYHNLDMWMSDSALPDPHRPAEIMRPSEEKSPAINQYQFVQQHLSINTKIFSVSFHGRQKKVQLFKPISFTLKHKDESIVVNPTCSYWNYSESSNSGYWLSNGCHLIHSNQSHTTCECDHLTNFAVLMDVTGTSTKIAAHHDLMLRAISIVGCTVSIICLIMSFITFVALKNLQCERNTIHKNLVLCLMVAELIFLFGVTKTNDKILCAVVAGLLHFFFLSSFAWMCLEGIQLYVMLIEVFESEKSRIKWFYLFGYGLPALIVGIAAAVDHTGYGTKTHCWLRTDNYFIWSFVGPVAAVITVNVVMLSIAIYMMYRHAGATSYKVKENSHLQKIKAWLKGAVVLVVLLGLTWAFGFLFLSEETIIMAYLFTILNSLQGLFIFVFHCVMNDKVKKEYRKYIQRSACLPNCLRVGAGYHGNLSNSPNPSSSSGNYLLKLWSGRRRKRSSTSTLTQSSVPSKANYRKSNISSYLSRESSFLPNDSKRFSNHSDKPLLSPTNGYPGMQTRYEDGAIAGDLSVIDGSIVDSEFVSEYCHNNLQISQEVKRYSTGSEMSCNKSCESVDKNRLSMLSDDSAVKHQSDFLPSEDQDETSNSESSDEEGERHNDVNETEQQPLLNHTESEQDLINGVINPNHSGADKNGAGDRKNYPSLTDLSEKTEDTPNKTNLSMPNLKLKPGELEKPHQEHEFGSHDALLYSLPDLSGIGEQKDGLEQTLSHSTNLRPVRIVPRKKVIRLSSDAQVRFDPHRYSLGNSEC